MASAIIAVTKLLMLMPLCRLNAGPRHLPPRFLKHLDAIGQSFPAVCNSFFDDFTVRHTPGNFRIFHKISAALVLRERPNREPVLIGIDIHLTSLETSIRAKTV
jgi:hypothetical protein